MARNQEANPRRRPPAPRGSDKGKQSLWADCCRGEITPRPARRLGLPGNQAAQTKLFSARAHSGRAKASAPPTRLTSHSRLSFLKNSSFSNLLLWSGTTRGIFPPSGRAERPRSGLARAAAGGLGADRLTAHPRRLDSRCSLFQEPARVGSRSRESEVRPSA